jgi:FtsZ-binding cell division protein ZapB
VQARWDELKSEMDGLREEGRKAWDERNGLFEKRNELQKQMVGWTSRF